MLMRDMGNGVLCYGEDLGSGIMQGFTSHDHGATWILSIDQYVLRCQRCGEKYEDWTTEFYCFKCMNAIERLLE